MRKLVLIFAIFTVSHAQSQSLEWVKQIGGPGIDRALSVAVDSKGYIYATGQYQGTVDFDPGPDSTKFTAASGGEAYLVKLDPKGNFIKVWTYGKTTGGHTVVGNNLKIDKSGNIYTAGYFAGSNVDFDPDSIGVFKLSYLNTGNNVYIQKLDSTGKFIWAVRWAYDMEAGSNNMAEEGPSMDMDQSGNFITVGRFTGTKDFDPGTGVKNIVGRVQDGYISKIDNSGKFQWVKHIACDTTANSYVFPKSVSLDNNRNIFVAGYFKGGVDFDTDSAKTNIIVTDLQVGFVAKYDPNGNYLWVKTIGNPNLKLLEYHVANAVKADLEGNIYVTGSFMDTYDFGNTKLTSKGNSDIFITKLDAAGNYIWAKQIGSFYDSETGFVLNTDNSNDVYVSGWFRGTADFNPGAGASNLTSKGLMDVFLVKLDNSGDFKWAASIEGELAGDLLHQLVIDGNSIVSVGRFQGNSNFNPNGSTILQASDTKADIFIQKISQSNIASIPVLVDAHSIIMYPNPASEQVTVRLNGSQVANTELSIIDLNGKVLQVYTTNQNQKTIFLNGFTKGVYFIRIASDIGVTTQKLIIK